MTVSIKIYVEDVNDRIDDGYDSIKVYRSANPATLDNTSTLVTTITLVADQEVYEYDDTSGTASLWYGYTLYDTTGPVETSISLKWRPNETTLLKLLEEVARRCAAGYASTVGAGSTSSRLVDEAIEDSADDENFGAGWWVYWYDAASAANQVPRRISTGYSSGGYAIGRSWSTDPTEGDGYLVTGLMPAVDVPAQPWSWQRAVNEGLTHCRWVDTLNLGAGDGRNQDFSLEAHLGYINPEQDIRKVFVRFTGDDGHVTDLDWTKNGRWFERVRQPGSYSLRLFPAPSSDGEVMVEVRREGDALYALTDTTSCPFEQAVEAGAWRALTWLAANGQGEYASQAESHRTLFEQRRRRSGAAGVMLT